MTTQFATLRPLRHRISGKNVTQCCRECRKVVPSGGNQRRAASTLGNSQLSRTRKMNMRKPTSKLIISPRAPRHVRFDWLSRVAACGGTSKCLHLGIALCWLAALAKAPGVRVGRKVLARYAISRDAAYDALRKLEAEKLLIVWRLPGRNPHVILLEEDGRPLKVVPSASA